MIADEKILETRGIVDPKAKDSVPKLTALLAEPNPAVRVAAIEALRQIPDRPAVPAVAEALKDKNRDVRRTPTSALIEALEDEDHFVRQRAAEALSRIGDPSAVPALIKLLHDEDSHVRGEATKALGQIGDPSAVPALLKVLNEDHHVNHPAARSLGKIGDTTAIPSLIAALSHDDRDVRQAAAAALGNIGHESSVTSLIAALKDDHPPVRRDAAMALGKIGDTTAIPSLIAALNDEFEVVSDAAAFALAPMGAPRGVSALINILNKWWRPYVCEPAAHTLGKIANPSAVPHLIAAFYDDDRHVRQAAVQALGNIPHPSAVSPLIQGLNDENDFIRQHAAIALGKIADPSTIPCLMDALKDDDRRVREAASEALKKIRIPPDNHEAIAKLEQLTTSEIPYVSATAHELLASAGVKEVKSLDHLITLLQPHPSDVRCGHENADHFYSTISGLRYYGPSAEEAIPPIIEVAEGYRDPRVQSATIDTIRSIDPDAQHGHPVWFDKKLKFINVFIMTGATPLSIAEGLLKNVPEPEEKDCLYKLIEDIASRVLRRSNWRIGRKITKEQLIDETDDLVNASIFRMLERAEHAKLGGFLQGWKPSNHKDFQGYLAKIIKLCVLDVLMGESRRREKYHDPSTLDHLPPSRWKSDAPTRHEDNRRRVENLVNKLTDAQQRRCATLKYLDGCSYEEIADVMGLTRNQVTYLLQTARQEFRQ